MTSLRNTCWGRRWYHRWLRNDDLRMLGSWNDWDGRAVARWYYVLRIMQMGPHWDCACGREARQILTTQCQHEVKREMVVRALSGSL